MQLLGEAVRATPKENIFLSPLSVFLALAMIENGAKNATKSAIRKALALAPEASDQAVGATVSALQHSLHFEGIELSIANAIWTDRHIHLLPAYVHMCEEIYGAKVAALDFSQPDAANKINAWVSENTRGKIPSIVTPQIVAASTVVLTNAVYFKGEWQDKFLKTATQDAPFHRAGGSTKTVPMMHHAKLPSAYRSGQGFQGVALSYANSAIALYALLPDRGKTPEQILPSIQPSQLFGANDIDVDLKLPRFTLDFSAGLAPLLKKMGMVVAFRYPNADFSAMGSKEFFISEVIHKTKLEVDEVGTVAAAATAVVMRAGSAMPQPKEKKILVFDRPFVVLIADASSGVCLFSGVIQQP